MDLWLKVVSIRQKVKPEMDEGAWIKEKKMKKSQSK
jgi:hypothetical protein